MTRINLLPWREELRKEKQQEILQLMGMVAIIAVAVVGAGWSYLAGEIANQEERNRYIEAEIEELDRQIAEIRDLNRRKADLIARERVIQDLQGNRPVIVRIFDQMVRTLGDGVFYDRLAVSGTGVSVSGVTESNARVAELMRLIDASEWFTAPNLRGLREASEFGEQASRFDLTFDQTLPAREGEEE